MRKLLTILFCLTLTSQSRAQDNVDFVNMMIGTYGERGADYGGTVPAVSTPFGMTQWVASTRINNISRTMYYYGDNSIMGFMATHQPAIWMADYGFMTLMPQVDSLLTDAESRQVRFSHSSEVSTPYYYKVSCADILTEFTATSHAACFHIVYPAGHNPLLMLEAGREHQGGGIEIHPERNEIYIYNCEQMNSDEDRPHANIGPKAPNLKCSYVLRFSQPFKTYGTWKDNHVTQGKRSEAGSHVGGYVEFASDNHDVEIRIGNSFIDKQQALQNLDKEMPHDLAFDQIVGQVRKAWNDKLSLIQVDSDAEYDKKVSFYTAMVHTMQLPREASEYGRYYSPFDGKVHEGIFYNDYSLWDTFRAEHPLLQLLCPERVDGMIEALVHMYEQGGWLPKWPNPTYSGIMIGSPADAVIADAYINGFRNYDVDKAYEAIRKDAFVAPDGDESNNWADRETWTGNYESRGGLTNYLRLGYVASDKTKESVSRTMEFGIEDYCVAQMAKLLKKKDDYKQLIRNMKNYRNLYNPKTGFFQARRYDGSWDNPEEGFTEGDKWTYRFCVMQDVNGTIELMGGKDAFIKALDDNFNGNHYVHLNEPGHHYAFLYDYCGRLDKVQGLIPSIINKNYHNHPDGLSGNDDCGQMSAWLIYASLGFYPVLPASGSYALGIPAFKHIKVHLKKGDLVIDAPQLGSSPTLDKVYWNGQPIKSCFIAVKDIMNGGHLSFMPR
ncbi:MAG: GH92 family glycosyl hydrolase [Prevotella sp.]|jgi:predicted alpha-1,2-mannosidase